VAAARRADDWYVAFGLSIYYVHEVDVQRPDSTFAPSPQTYATAAFGEGRVREGQTSCGLDAMSPRGAVRVGNCRLTNYELLR